MVISPEGPEAPDSQDEDKIPAFELTEKDRQNLARQDSDFHPHTWKDLKQIIEKNDLESLRRWPSDLKRYLRWTRITEKKYGTITNYILTEKLQRNWTPIPPSSSSSTAPPNANSTSNSHNPNSESSPPIFATENPTPLSHPHDYTILLNDWPYGLALGITHIIIWLKHRLDSDAETGDLVPEARSLVEDFVKRVFGTRVASDGGDVRDQVLWFRNWTGLQSVRGVEHVHVLVRGVGEGVVKEWTGIRGREDVGAVDVGAVDGKGKGE